MLSMTFWRKIRGVLAAPQTETSESEHYGLDLKTGDRHYRAWVGPPEEYDLIGALQTSLLLAAGLEEKHRLCDVGCGSLRAGRMLIPYLRTGRYFGVEPEQWLVVEGLKKELGNSIWEAKQPSFRFVSDFSLQGFDTEFDFVIAQSVFSHTLPKLLRLGLRNIAGTLASSGKLFATWNEAASGKDGLSIGPAGSIMPNGWIHKGVYAYSWENMQDHLRDCGLVGRRLRWPHPRQSWFVASRPEDEAPLDELSRTIRSPRPGWGKGR
jgi:SAM-dependent methyltransferase